jgi:hypothetical protein
MLTKEAYLNRFWGQLTVLRQVFGDRELPERHCGFTSVSDNVFEAINRHLKISILVDEYEEAITTAASMDPQCLPPLIEELRAVSSMLQYNISIFERERQRVEEVRHRVTELLNDARKADSLKNQLNTEIEGNDVS